MCVCVYCVVVCVFSYWVVCLLYVFVLCCMCVCCTCMCVNWGVSVCMNISGHVEWQHLYVDVEYGKR